MSKALLKRQNLVDTVVATVVDFVEVLETFTGNEGNLGGEGGAEEVPAIFADIR